MPSITDQINAIDAGLTLVQQQFPELPKSAILTSRLLILLGREINTQLDQRLKPHGLTELEYRTLMYVHLHSLTENCAYPGELCSSLAQSPANMTRLTDALVARELITRIPDAQDRRRLVLQTTPSGEALANNLLPMLSNSIRNSYRDFSADDLQTLISLLKRLAQMLDKTSVTDEEHQS